MNKKTIIGIVICILALQVLVSCNKGSGRTGVRGEIVNYSPEDNISLVLWKWNHTNRITNVVATLTPDSSGKFRYTGLEHGESYNLTIYKGNTRPEYSSGSNNKLFMANAGSIYVVIWREVGDGWETTSSWE